MKNKLSILSWNIDRLGYYENNLSYPENAEIIIDEILDYIENEKSHPNILMFQELPIKYIQDFKNRLSDYTCVINPLISSLKDGGIVATFVHKDISFDYNEDSSKFYLFGLRTEITINHDGMDSLNLLNIHIPPFTSTNDKKKGMWANVLNYARKKDEQRTIIMGDFNTYLHQDADANVPSSMFSENLNHMILIGYKDAWNKGRMYSYFQDNDPKKGRRLDYAFLSNRITNNETYELEYDPSILKINNKSLSLSDHASMLLTLTNNSINS